MPSAFSDAPPQPARLWRGLLHWRLPASSGRLRPVALDPWRWTLLTLGLITLSLGGFAAQLWWSHHQAARQSADSAIAFIESRMAEIDEPMRRLHDADELRATELLCSPALTARLLHESLSSLLIQRLLVRSATDAHACGPAGAVQAPELAIEPGADLALLSQRSIATQLTAVRQIGGQRSAVALLDPRALSLPAHGPLAFSAGMAESISLKTADGRTLRVWGRQTPIREPIESLRATRHSAIYQLGVSVEISVPVTAWEEFFSSALALRPQESTSKVPFFCSDQV